MKYRYLLVLALPAASLLGGGKLTDGPFGAALTGMGLNADAPNELSKEEQVVLTVDRKLNDDEKAKLAAAFEQQYATLGVEVESITFQGEDDTTPEVAPITAELDAQAAANYPAPPPAPSEPSIPAEPDETPSPSSIRLEPTTEPAITSDPVPAVTQDPEPTPVVPVTPPPVTDGPAEEDKLRADFDAGIQLAKNFEPLPADASEAMRDGYQLESKGSRYPGPATPAPGEAVTPAGTATNPVTPPAPGQQNHGSAPQPGDGEQTPEVIATTKPSA